MRFPKHTTNLAPETRANTPVPAADESVLTARRTVNRLSCAALRSDSARGRSDGSCTHPHEGVDSRCQPTEWMTPTGIVRSCTVTAIPASRAVTWYNNDAECPPSLEANSRPAQLEPGCAAPDRSRLSSHTGFIALPRSCRSGAPEGRARRLLGTAGARRPSGIPHSFSNAHHSLGLSFISLGRWTGRSPATCQPLIGALNDRGDSGSSSHPSQCQPAT